MAPSEMTYEDNLPTQYISHSLSALSRSKSTNNLIVRTYKQATQLYLTRRFQEALHTLEPIITSPQTEHDTGNGSDQATPPPAATAAPVAQSAKSTRTKVWVFYLSLLNSIIELGAEEGRLTFGAAKWKALATQVRDGSIWEEIVRRGYGGSEGDVDADVVVNLATLLLAHMQDQRLNQQRLETYLASSDAGAGGQLSWSQDGMSTPMSTSSSSPKNLATRLKILELYTLHVLPANGEWEYARSFIDVNDMLDEERKDAFLAALEHLREEKEGGAQRQRELEEQREREMEEERQRIADEEAAAAARRAEEAKREEERRRLAEIAAAEKQKAAAATRIPNGNASKPPPPPPSITKANASSSAAKAHKKSPSQKAPPPPPTFYRRASSLLTNFQQLVVQAGQGMNTMALLRLCTFVLAFLLIVARRDLRLKLQRAVEDGWTRVKRTVGMGVK